MRGSLASLPRMSMDQLNVRDDTDRTLRIWLLSAAQIEGTTFYRLAGRFQSNGQTWEVNRRYSEFLALRAKLIRFFEDQDDACPGCLNYLASIQRFEFPKKHLFSSKNPAVINYRVKALRSFMNLLASWAFSNLPKCPLCGGYAFELVRNFVVDGAEPMTGSDMDYIRGSISIEAFASSGERPSAFARPSGLERRHSWIPASGSATLKAHQAQQQKPNATPPTSKKAPTGSQQPDAYDTFNDYLPARPSQRTKPSSNVDANQSNQKFSVQKTKPGEKSSFLLYNDGGDGAASSSDIVSFGSVSTNNETKLRKHKSEPHNVARLQNDSFLSFASTDNEVKEADEDESSDDAVSDHSNMLSSPNVQPAKSKSTNTAALTKEKSQLFDSFISEDLVEPISSDDDDRRYGSPSVSPSDEEVKVDDDSEDEDEIDITGVALNSPPPKGRAASRSGENLWQPWELARGG
uniref:PX domain-containing protein n=1 Tax=Globisporangium ultimum (strain ATCC 200006 / CBS 805.95 / DAOM BR144) TaxID=431595 RepID=K3W714_GLOUD